MMTSCANHANLLLLVNDGTIPCKKRCFDHIFKQQSSDTHFNLRICIETVETQKPRNPKVFTRRICNNRPIQRLLHLSTLCMSIKFIIYGVIHKLELTDMNFRHSTQYLARRIFSIFYNLLQPSVAIFPNFDMLFQAV